jgi:predicted nucleotidyltransferase component of viral defense system
MKPANFARPGVWQALWAQALLLVDHLERHAPGVTWTFGGGTVLMLRIAHRQSKDIDLFVPDPQYLGFVNPRLSEVAEQISSDYEETAESIKLFLPEGEIDIVAGSPLTASPWEVVEVGGRQVRVETCAEIVAKKMWHRGERANARDLYDLCAVADAEPDAIAAARPWFARHGAAFIEGLEERADLARVEFDQIDSLGSTRDFDACLAQARAMLTP